MTKERTIKVANAAFEWCLKTFGNPLKTESPILKVSFDKRVKTYTGIYYERELIVYPNVCGSYMQVVKTVIHEYCHFLQMPKIKDGPKYSKLYDKFGYKDHPYEIEAYSFEKKHFKKCYYEIIGRTKK